MNKFIPRETEAYYYLDSRGSVYRTRYYSKSKNWHDKRIAMGNCFMTGEDAEEALQALKERVASMED